jgi:5-methylcytosine-specific restriction endonuclease McrA
MIDVSAGELVSEILQTRKKVSKIKLSIRLTVTKIENKYSPGVEFDTWRNSNDCKRWKTQQYDRQARCCAICREHVELKDSHIDHIKPLAQYPELNIDLKNLQITHPSCNLSKGDKDI